MAALLKANEAALQAFLSDPDGKVAGVQPTPGAPPAKFGQWYYAVHFGSITGDDPNALSNDKLYGVQVTISARTAYAPTDRKGRVLVTEGDVIDRAEAVADLLGMSYDVMNAANLLIDGFGVTTNGFCEPLKFQDITPPVAAPPEWFGGTDGSPDVLVSTVTFVGARRVRPL